MRDRKHDEQLVCTVCGKPIESGEGHYRAGVHGIHVTCDEKFAKQPGRGALLSYRDSMTLKRPL